MALTKAKGHILADDLALGGNPTTSTQSTGNNTTRIATTAFVQTEIAALADSAPAALNTLNELAAALGDDANFSTTVTTSIATKLPLAGGTMTGSLIIAKDDNTFTVQSTNAGQASVDIKNTEGHFRLITDAGALKVYDQTDSSERFKIDTSGNVGIGVTSVGEKLHVKGTGRFENSHSTPVSVHINSGNNDYGQIFASTASAWKNLVLNQYGGNVGIGTTSPTNKLEIKADSAHLRLQGATTTTKGLALLFDNSNNRSEIRSDQAGVNQLDLQYYALNHKFGRNASLITMTLTDTGNVGIGTTSPGFTLEVKADKDTWLSRIYNTGSDSNAQSLLVRSDATAAHDALVMGVYADSGYKMVVKSNGNVGIGTIAPTQKLDVAGTALLENAKLKAISESNSLTVQDLFIYDTTKDSDGGAWRKKIKHTAWYNEATSSTRSSRKEFPSIAILAFTLTQELYIYDGDDPDLGLWAKYSNFTQDSGGFASITAVNGSIYCAQASSSYNYSGNGYFQLNFAADYFFSNILSVFGTHKQGRADGLLTTYDYRPRGDRTTPKYELVANGYQISDIAVKVLDNASIDTETGLPKPTIALAGYYGGLSVIKDTGVVVDITASAGAAYSGVTWVDITKNNNLIFEQDNSSNPRSIFCIPIPSKDRTSATSDGIINDKVVMKFYRGGTHKPYPCFNGAGVNEAVALEGDNQLLRSNASAGGDLTILEPNLVSPALGKVAYIGHDYNSGWLVGDTKVATLSDTSTTSATSPDLVTNGSNFTNTTGWTGSAATVSVSSSELLVTGTATVNQNQSAIWTTISCAKGDQFQVTFRISAFVANQSSAGIIVGGATIHKNNDLGYWYPNTAATHTTTVTATSTTFTLYLHAGISVGVVTRFDDISIHKLQNDRTQYKHGFQTFGTLAKSVVATGAELVGYGPFSASNYLQQSYTSELDFNSGDFAYCFWSNNPHTGPNYICDRAEGNGNYRIAIYLTTTEVAFYTRDTAATEVAAAISTPNQWTQIWCIRRGTSHEIWINGVNKVATDAAVRDISAASGEAVQVIGTRYNQNGPNTGKIALLRVSGTVPSEEQIVKIYNDERKLFEINSDATMGGSSSAATVLAYDDVRKEMHVGSSWGRSVFQGLSRVEFDSDVPTTSLSVNDGFVVEE